MCPYLLSLKVGSLRYGEEAVGSNPIRISTNEMDEMLKVLTSTAGGADAGMTESQARAFVDRFDKDHDGKLEPHEFVAFHRALLQGEGGEAAMGRARHLAAERRRASLHTHQLWKHEEQLKHLH